MQTLQLEARYALLTEYGDEMIGELIEDVVRRRSHLLPGIKGDSRLSLGQQVSIGPGVDGTFPYQAFGQRGTVCEVKPDGPCGETPEDPAYVVEFGAGSRDTFWREELRLMDEAQVPVADNAGPVSQAAEGAL